MVGAQSRNTPGHIQLDIGFHRASLKLLDKTQFWLNIVQYKTAFTVEGGFHLMKAKVWKPLSREH